MENMIKFYPEEHRNLKEMDQASKKYKKELLNFMKHFNVAIKLIHLDKEDDNYKFKKVYQKCIKMTITWFWIFFAINVIENGANEIRGVFYWTNTEIIHFTRYMIGFWFSLLMIIIWSFRSRDVLLEYFSSLVQKTPIKCPHLSVKEVLNLINIHEYTQEFTNSEIKFICINCSKKVREKLTITQKINNDYTIYEACPKCDSGPLFYYKGNLDEEYFNNLKDFWIEN